MLKHFCWVLALPVAAAWADKPAVKDEPKTAEIGKAVRDFALKDTATDKETTTSFAGKVTVVLFYSHTCSTCPDYDKRLAAFASDYAGKLTLLGVNSNPEHTVKECREAWAASKTGFPLLKDVRTKTAEYMGATNTPMAFIIDAKGILRYAGGFDDNPDEGAVKKRHLRTAIDEVLAGKTVTTPKTEALGCPIIYAD